MTEQEIYEVIAKVAKNHRAKKFGSYSSEDIEQEVWIIALEKMPDFELDKVLVKDPQKKLEHWLNTVVSNRLKNFYRDKHVVPSKYSKTITSPNPLSIVNEERTIEELKTQKPEQWEVVLRNLNELDIEVLDAWFSGERITSYYKCKLRKKINKIVVEQCPTPKEE